MASDPKALIAAKFLDSFLCEIVLDTAIHTHAKIKRARSICHLCGFRCQAHTPAAEQSSTNGLLSADSTATPNSRSGTPVPGSASTSTKPDYYSNNPLFECLVCSRQVSSNRYATHLAKCMGMGSKGGRKGAARNAKTTTATSSLSGSIGRSGAGTPRYSSDLDDDSFAKRKNGMGQAKNGTKRANSPLAASTLANARMNKRIKTSSPTPPPSENLASAGGMNRSYSSQTFAPSGLSNSTVLSGSPLNPNNNNSTTNGKPYSTSKSNGNSRLGKNDNSKKRKRLIEDDEDDDDRGGSYRDHGGSDGDSNEEEGEISDDDVALAASSSRPPSSGTKIKIPIRTTPSSASGSKSKTFAIADDSDEDSDPNPSHRPKTHPPSDDDDDDDDDDENDDDDDDDDDDEDDDDDDDDTVQLTRVSHSTGVAGAKKNRSSTGDGGGGGSAVGLQRERGSDGEFIDVESASEQSDADSF